MTLENQSAQKKSHNKEILLLLATLVFMFFVGEIFFRVYYFALDKPIAANQDELCFKELKLAKSYFSVDPNNFRYKEFWDEDQLIGLIPRKNYSNIYSGFVSGIAQNPVNVIIYREQYHNSQGLTNIEEFSLKKPKNSSVRIALFGDSFTCGAESPLKLNVGYILNQLIPNAEELNFCMIGHGIDHMYARYALESKQYFPDVVVFSVLVDDLRRPFDCSLLRPNLTISNGHLIIGPRKWATLNNFYFNYSPPKYESYFIKHILWVYDEHVRFERDIQKGIELFKVMIDELKTQTKEQNATLIFVPIIEEEPSQLEQKSYKKMLEILKEKNTNFLDLKEYLNSKKKQYGNQSFYYIRSQDHYKHFSPIGNALFAQGIKNVLELKGVVDKTSDYFFANFKDMEFIYLIPENLTLQLQGKIKVISAFETKERPEDKSFSLLREKYPQN